MADAKQPPMDHHRVAAYRAGLVDRLSKMQFKQPGRHRDILTVDDAEGQLSTIVSGYEAIRAHEFTEEDKASMQVLFANYINEIWLSEFPPPQQANNTIDVVEALLSGDTEGARAVLSGLFPADRCDRILMKLQNVHAACVELFGPNFCAFVDRDFDVTLAMRLHQIAGKGVIEDAGKYRTKLVHACRSNAAYALPHLIAHRMEALFAFARETKQQYTAVQDARARTRSMLKLGTLFFSEFLLIHPFSNGNGRTARLLVNYLLRDTTVVPFSLFYKDRQIYLDVLEDRSNAVLSPPDTLAFYVLVCAARAVCDQLSLLSLTPVEAAAVPEEAATE